MYIFWLITDLPSLKYVPKSLLGTKYFISRIYSMTITSSPYYVGVAENNTNHGYGRQHRNHGGIKGTM